MPGPDPAASRTASPHREVGAPVPHVLEEAYQVAGVHRPVTIHHRDVLGSGGHQTRVHRGAITRLRLINHPGAHPTRHVGGAVAGAVVDHHRPEPPRQLGQKPGQRWRLVTTREHQVTHGSLGGHHCNLATLEPVTAPGILNKD